ncbi:MAG TPA: hypothetical protein VEJ63_02850 [Planctomycetota bacterium]|nr:hypothetical protein [Planctomycetota bacterium]
MSHVGHGDEEKDSSAAASEWQHLSETQKAFEKAKKKRHRRGVSIAPTTSPGGEDEITIEPEDEGATPAAEAEYVAPDAPLETEPDSRKEKNKERKGSAQTTRSAEAQSAESNKVHGGAMKPRKESRK